MRAVVNNWLSNLSKADVVTLISILLSAAAFLTALWGWTLRAWLTERRLVKEFGADLYLPEDIKNATRYYVRPDATSVDLAQEMEEGGNVVATREDLFKAIERFIDEESRHRHLLLLADSGMGKSSFVLNYYDYNRRKWWGRYKLAVIPLGNKKALKKIEEIKNPKETILFLDAFDEDPEARAGYEKRLEELMQACSEFRRILITCRTQFFPKDAAIPKVASWVFAPRDGQAQHTFWRLYLAPFSDQQVNKFLRRRFWFWEWEKKRRARELAKKVPKLTVRPMLLTHIPELIQAEKHVSTTWDIYEIMTERWYMREEAFWQSQDALKGFSEEVAVQLYLSFLRNGSDRLPKEAITGILKPMLSNIKDIDEWNATTRSLLHRDAAGNWKFAHRSIMEFLFLKKFFAGDERCRGVAWTDQMKKFVVESSWIPGRPLFLLLGTIAGADLSGVDLMGLHLAEAELSKANFTGANLRQTDLRGANFSGANLSRTNLSQANLRAAILHEAILNGAILHETNLNGATLRYAILDNADLRGADLSGTYLHSIRLSGMNLSGARLDGADLSAADLKGANLRWANLEETNLSNADLSETDLTDANFRGANLNYANLNGAYLKATTLRGANLCGVDLTTAHLFTSFRDLEVITDENTKLPLSMQELKDASVKRGKLSQ